MAGSQQQGGSAPAPEARAAPGRVAQALKVVAGASSVLGLIFALVQANKLLSERAERGRRLAEQRAVAERQLASGDHAAAWASAEAAAEVDARRPELRRLQEDVAMAWLRAAAVRSTGGPRSFTEQTDLLVPTLDRGILETTGVRRADLLAHRGWADFLRRREGGAGDPARHYADAVAADPGNPYAHAMWGHWLLWDGGARQEALDHFARAAASGREREYVRALQLAALSNAGTPESEAEILRVANAIRLEGGGIDPGHRRQIHNTYWQRMSDSTGRAALLAALEPAAHLATYRWLFTEDLRDSTREASYHLHLAQLQAHAGDTAGALATFRRLAAMDVPWRPGERRVIEAALGPDAPAARP